VVPSQTASLKSVLYQLNQPVSAGSYIEPFDPTSASNFQVPRTGVYALSANVGFNVDAVNGATIGPSDYFAVEVVMAGGPPTAAITVAMKPWNMAGTSATPSGQDYGVSGTAMGVLQAGVWYQFVVYVSGSITSPRFWSPSLTAKVWDTTFRAPQMLLFMGMVPKAQMSCFL
jgi:hypothetical protein